MLQNEGLDEVAPIPMCTRDFYPHLSLLSDCSQVQGAYYCLVVKSVTLKVDWDPVGDRAG